MDSWWTSINNIVDSELDAHGIQRKRRSNPKDVIMPTLRYMHNNVCLQRYILTSIRVDIVTWAVPYRPSIFQRYGVTGSRNWSVLDLLCDHPRYYTQDFCFCLSQ